MCWRMIAPRVIVVGHCTANSAAILCSTNREAAGDGAIARLAWRAGAASGTNDVPLTDAPPCVVGVHHLENLPASAEIRYGIAIAGRGMTLPEADEILAVSNRRAFRLLPVDRPLRVALVTCNGADEIKAPAQRH